MRTRMFLIPLCLFSLLALACQGPAADPKTASKRPTWLSR